VTVMEESTIGRDAIDHALMDAYPGIEPIQFPAQTPFTEAGGDPLDEIAVFRDGEAWHYISYGLSELYDKESDNDKLSGFGFELCFLLHDPTGKEPPGWPLMLLQNLARYVFETGNLLDAGHGIDLEGPITLEAETIITGIALAQDPVLSPIETPHGSVTFLLVFGITDDELKALESSSPEDFIAAAKRVNPDFLTTLQRKSWIENSQFYI